MKDEDLKQLSVKFHLYRASSMIDIVVMIPRKVKETKWKLNKAIYEL